jgi:hypothetical protein
LPANVPLPAAKTAPKPSPVFRGVAVFCALAVWTLGLLAASPQLHAALHHDADHQDHSCAVTLFSHGVENGTEAVLSVGAPLLLVTGSCPVAPVALVTNAPHRLPPACGPPRS